MQLIAPDRWTWHMRGLCMWHRWHRDWGRDESAVVLSFHFTLKIPVTLQTQTTISSIQDMPGWQSWGALFPSGPWLEEIRWVIQRTMTTHCLVMRPIGSSRRFGHIQMDGNYEEEPYKRLAGQSEFNRQLSQSTI